MKEREAHNLGATMYVQRMQDIHEQAKQTNENTRDSMTKYYDSTLTEQPCIEVGDLVKLNVKNIPTKRLSKKLRPKLDGSLIVLEKKGNRAYTLEISPQWKIYPVFHICLLEPYRSTNRQNYEQRSRDPEDIEGDLE